MTCGLIDYSSPYLNKAGITETQSGETVAAIKAASVAIERYCKRSFSLASHDELQTAGQFGTVFFNHYPVTQLNRVYTSVAPVFEIRCAGAVSSASYNTTATALRLSHTASGTTTATALAYSDYPTITSLVGAIDGVGSGWAASVLGSFGGYPSVDLLADQWQPVSSNYSSVAAWSEGGQGVRYDAAAGVIYGLGRDQCIRLVYQAGFATVPEDIQQVCANVVANMLDNTSGQIQSESLGDYSYTLATDTVDRLPFDDRKVLDSYRDRRM